ncbi:MAG: hypothetical protein U9R54_06430 [Bacteroidota bacterium]|nr:hypothetical protein [Bacteroidota bacterium]
MTLGTGGEDVKIGIAAYSFSNSSEPTAYTVQGFWEWDESALGAYSSRYDVIGLNFQGSTIGYYYNCQSNNIHTAGSVNYDLLDYDDNGVAYTQEDFNILTEGAMWAKVVSPETDTSKSFNVSFIYEYFSGDPDPSYLDELVEYIVGLAFNIPSPINSNERFDVIDYLMYGNN